MRDGKLSAAPAPPVEPARRGQDRKAKEHMHEQLFQLSQRNGGEPFFAPFVVGTASLTEKVVAYFKQFGFFAFETMERLQPRNRRNKFTRHGSSRFMGTLRPPRR